jgi:hypothetical protein
MPVDTDSQMTGTFLESGPHLACLVFQLAVQKTRICNEVQGVWSGVKAIA